MTVSMIVFLLFLFMVTAVGHLFLTIAPYLLHKRKVKNFIIAGYLGHEFHSRNIRDLPNDFYCKICNRRVYVIAPYKYPYDYSNAKYDLTCEEQQIKNLLE